MMEDTKLKRAKKSQGQPVNEPVKSLEGAPPEEAKGVMKEAMKGETPLSAIQLREEWRRLGLNVALPILSNRIDLLEKSIWELAEKIDSVEQSCILANVRLDVLEKAKLTTLVDIRNWASRLRMIRNSLEDILLDTQVHSLEEEK